MVRTLQYPSPA